MRGTQLSPTPGRTPASLTANAPRPVADAATWGTPLVPVHNNLCVDRGVAHLQVLPCDAKPVTSWLHAYEARASVAEAIRKVVAKPERG